MADINLGTVTAKDSTINIVKGDMITIYPNPDGNQSTHSIPPRPGLFFGRDDLLRKTVEYLLSGHHVALLGPGGIGKSSIAEAVLHETAIVDKFGNERYFVRFDDVHFSQVSFHLFLERMAQAVGVKAASVQKRLSDASDKILVFDNAETFLDTEMDADQIAKAIQELADTKSVQILLTTRIARIPLDVCLKTIKVPPLDEEAAHAAFASSYGDVCPPNVGKLLSTLEFHPLCIVLLARAARQNEWLPKELEKAFKQHLTHLLNDGKGKSQSLKITIELSLDSPSIKDLGASAHHFLRAVAFLPTGVDKEKLKDLFPTLENIDLLSRKLLGHSMLYLDGERFTMLPPIRMYFTSSTNPDLSSTPLLADVRNYYYSQLTKFVKDGQEVEARAWIMGEDINVEHLISLFLPAPQDMQASFQACNGFVQLLMRHKLRPTALCRMVMDLPQSTPSFVDGILLRLWPEYRNTHPLASKGTCVQSLAELADILRQTREALKLYQKADELFRLARNYDAANRCMRDEGDVLASLGDFIKAENLFKNALSECQDPDEKARLKLSLGYVAMFTRKSNSRELFMEAEHHFESVGDKKLSNLAVAHRGYSELYVGNYHAARQCFEQTLSTSKDCHTLLALSEVSSSEGDLPDAFQLLDDAMKVAKDDGEFSFALAVTAALHSNEGDFFRAREQIKEAIKKVTHPDDDNNTNLASFVYISARNELYADDLSAAEELFSRALVMFKDLSDIRFEARCERALGEIAFLREHFEEANAKFERAWSLCKDMGISAELLYICFSSFSLKDSFGGWKKFRKEHISSL